MKILKNLWQIAATLGVLALVAVLGFQLFGASPAPVAAAAPSEQGSLTRSITVVGNGSVSSQPDVATAMVGVEVISPTVNEATTQATEKMAKILAALKAQGIVEKDIQTSNYSINFETRQPSDMPAINSDAATPEQTGVYHVSNMLSVKIRDLTKVGTVIDEVVKAGANSIWGVNFTIDDTKKLEGDARIKAMADAKSRAEELAKLAGVKLGGVLQVSEVITGSPLYGGYAKETALMSGGGVGIQPGEMQISMQIQVTYAIE